MPKNLLKKLVDDEDIHHTSFNFAVAYGFGFAASVISNSVFKYNLNRFRSVEHFAVGVAAGLLLTEKYTKKQEALLWSCNRIISGNLDKFWVGNIWKWTCF